MFHHHPGVSPKQLCVSAHLECIREGAMSELYPNFEKLLASVEQNILQYQLLQVESFQIVIKIPPKIYLQKFETQTA